MNPQQSQSIFLYCRQGFEAECAAEIQEKAANLDIHGYCKAKNNSAYVIFTPVNPEGAEELCQLLDFGQLVFARQWFVVLIMRNDLPITDRLGPLVQGLTAMPAKAESISIETPDTNEAKQLSSLCKSIKKPAESLLAKAGLYQRGQTKEGLCCHISFMSTHAAYAGYSYRNNSASWPTGIPRLRFPAAAPSRSTLKLDEAFLTFLTEGERERVLQPGMLAVDLGASPGGWTLQLVQRGLKVTAVDNGAMSENVMETGLVAHLREDGYTFQPDCSVDWMVCDIVEKPIRTAEMAAKWLINGWCKRAMFNLKLPMKKRWQELKRCLDLIEKNLHEANVSYELKAKQLYHDREEVTVYISQ